MEASVQRVLDPWGLTSKQQMCLYLLGTLGGYKRVADRLDLGMETVKEHISLAIQKTGARDGTVAAVRWAVWNTRRELAGGARSSGSQGWSCHAV
jgi:DNA-binding NarL/FixJ family response regulator